MKNHNLMWFRKDLRIRDNSALHFACKDHNAIVSSVYISISKQKEKKNITTKKNDFLSLNLISLKNNLQKLGINFFYLESNSFISCAENILQICKNNQINNFFYNYQYETLEKKEEKKIIDLLLKNNIFCSGFHDNILFLPSIQNKNFNIKRFSLFQNKMIQFLQTNKVKCYPIPKIRKFQKNIIMENYSINNLFNKKFKNIYFPITELIALKKLIHFCKNKIKQFSLRKNFVFEKNTSLISPYLNIGVLSVRQCLLYLLKYNSNCLIQYSNQNWINQFIWKEYYQNLLKNNMLSRKNKDFFCYEKKIFWENNIDFFNAWKTGKTGYPIVDSGMRQLNQFGWINNRIRMICASFLVKDLLVHWEKGEKYFMSKLIDGNFASNRGGWIWCSSIGIYSSPYFQIFNPTLQSKKFDLDGKYIKQFLPELKCVPKNHIHEPHIWATKNNFSLQYPMPIVRHDVARKKFMQFFKKNIDI